MSTTSTLVEAKNALVSAIETALATAGTGNTQVPVFYAWNPEVTDESVFLGIAQLSDSDFTRTTTTYSSPVAEFTALQAGDYRIEGTCWCFRPDLTPDQAATAEGRVDALWELIRSALAPLTWTGELGVEFRLRAWQSGWAAEAAFTVQVHSFIS